MLSVEYVVPERVHDLLIGYYRQRKDWVTFESADGQPFTPIGVYRAVLNVEGPFPRAMIQNGGDLFAVWAQSVWLATGPKSFVPTAEQRAALENVELRLEAPDFEMPYPALLVEVDYPPFTGVIVAKHVQRAIVCVLVSDRFHNDDIVTTICGIPGGVIEDSITRYDAACAVHSQSAAKSLRVALNSCLCLTHFGNHLDYLFPKERERLQRVARRKDERGRIARRRFSLQLQVASLTQNVKLHEPRERTEGTGESTGRTVGFHWRRGHWRMQPHGPKNSLRKRILIKPVMIHPELFVGDEKDTKTTYLG